MMNELVLVFGTLFAIVNPISTSFIFIKLVKDFSKRDRDIVALKACLSATITMIIFYFSGQYILDFFGITLYAFKVAGGIYLFTIAFEMLSPQLRKKPENYKEERDSIAIIPLAIPLLSGPGALTSVLVLSTQTSMITIILAILLVMFISWIVLYFAPYIQSVLGRTGIVVFERIMGIIVLVVSVQFVFNGVTGYLATLGINMI